MRKWIALSVALASSAVLAQGNIVPPAATDDARVDRLLKQMSLEEKMQLIRGEAEPEATNQGQAGYLPGVARLGIPPLRFADGPPGVLTRVAGQAQTATMGVAATWSIHDAEQNGVAIGRSARSLGIDVILQPFINIDRDLTFARSYNTFGEDPMLTGAIGAAEIRGAQAQGVMAQAKHYVAYDSDSYNIFVDPQTLREVYVAPFRAAIDAGVASIMCSYNKVNGTFACGNADTLKTILREELGFKGFVTSDWGGVHNVHFLNDGLTMEMPGIIPADSPFSGMMKTYFSTAPSPTGPVSKPNEAAMAGMLGGTIPEERAAKNMDLDAFPRDQDPNTMLDALADGSIHEATVTDAARRVLGQMVRFGYLDGKQKHDVTPQDLEGNGRIIEKTAEDAAVLLKNDGNVLPLKPADLNGIVLIGPTAQQIAAIGTFGERSPGVVGRQVGPLEALRKLAPGASIAFAVDDDMTGVPIPTVALSHGGQAGLQRAGGSNAVDATLDFTSARGNALPANSVVTWNGNLTVKAAGEYWLYLQALGTRATLTVDGKEVGRTGATKGTVHGDVQYPTQDNGLPTTDGLDNVRRAIQLTAGAHTIAVTTSADTSNAPVQVRLNWMTPERRQADHAAAIAAAKKAKVAVVFAWTRDKPKFGLPGEQDRLIEEVAAVNPNTVVVLNTSQPVAMPWVDKVKGVLEMWWTGDEGGTATAKLLTGQANPGGRLPVTWARKLTDYAPNDPAHPERSTRGVDGKTTFSEGVLVGYRWFDAQHIQPLFPFGYGMSYTTFAFSGLTVKDAGHGNATVTLRVQNKGAVAGDAVPQVYLDAPADRPADAQFAPKTLVAFDRVTLEPGQSREITLQVPARAFEYWSTAQSRWMRPAGPRTLHAGASSRDLPLEAHLQ